VHVTAAGSRMVGAAGMKACGLHRDRFAVGWSPIEDPIVLTECERAARPEQRGEYAEFSHFHKYWRGAGMGPS